MYLLSLPMAFDHWLTGIGLGSYTLLSPIYLTDYPVGVHNDRAHNEYLELMIELGLPMATLLFFWIFAGIVRLVLALQADHRLQRNRKVLATAAICGLIGFLLHGLVDFGWRLPANLFYAVTLLAVATVCLQPKEESERLAL